MFVGKILATKTCTDVIYIYLRWNDRQTEQLSFPKATNIFYTSTKTLSSDKNWKLFQETKIDVQNLKCINIDDR